MSVEAHVVPEISRFIMNIWVEFVVGSRPAPVFSPGTAVFLPPFQITDQPRKPVRVDSASLFTYLFILCRVEKGELTK